MNNKALGAIVATMLLLLVGVGMYIGIQSWYKNYQSEFQSKIIPIGNVEIEGLDGETLYIRNKNNAQVYFNSIKINGIDCNLNGTLNSSDINFINLSDCLSQSPDGKKEIVIFSNSGVFKKSTYMNNVIFTQTEISSGIFSGYAFGEQFGYISFNGTDYQVIMNNNSLSGNAYSENLGYISFNGTEYGVINNDGILSGYAFGEQLGFINFNNSPMYQVTFNQTHLEGYAYSEFFGYINFNNLPNYQINFT